MLKSHRRTMAPTNKYWRARATTSDIWDRTHKKLAVLVLEVDDSIAQEKLVCTLRAGKLEQKSHKLKSGVCGEFFFFSLDEGGDLVIEVSKCLALRRSEFAGEAVLPNPMKEHEEEDVIDLWLPLQPRAGKKDKVQGKIHIRFLYSCSAETKPTEDRGQQIFFYDDYIDSFKTGDLIAYSGIGALHSMTKLATNSPYSHVGMIFRLPNKWTRRDDLFVLEVARNNEGFLDAFLERPHSGVALYRLFERIHQYQGTKIWWAPLQANISIDTQKLVDRMWKTHEENVDFLQPRVSGRPSTTRDKPFFSLETDLFSEINNGAIGKDNALWEPLSPYNVSRQPQQKAEVVELLDTKLLTLLFNAAGVKQQIASGMKVLSNNQRLYPVDVVKYECFGQPILLRDVDFSVQTQKSQLPQHFFIVQDPVAQMGVQAAPSPGSGSSLPQQGYAAQPQPQPQLTPPQTPPHQLAQQGQPMMYAVDPAQQQQQAMMAQQAAATLRPPVGGFYPPQQGYPPQATPPHTPPGPQSQQQQQQQQQQMFMPAMYAYPATQMPAAYLPQYYPGSPHQVPYGGAMSSSALPSVYDVQQHSGSPHYPSPLSDSGGGHTNPPPFNPEYAAAHEFKRLSLSGQQ